MPEKTILFVTHTKKQCGVYQFGKDVFEAISKSKRYHFIKLECECLRELEKAVEQLTPDAIIYNFHPSVMPWLFKKLFKGVYQSNIAHINVVQIGIIHEITQVIADGAKVRKKILITKSNTKILNSFFDFYICSDPTITLTKNFLFKTGRLIPYFQNETTSIINLIPVIGSFGFATPNKGFENLVLRVQEEYDHALIRINMPFAEFGDKVGENARRIAVNCAALVTKPGIKLNITHDFLNSQELLEYLSKNDLNVFNYQDKKGRGISSAADLALAVKKPIAVSDCPMFRHLLKANPGICLDYFSLKDIEEKGFNSLEGVSEKWTSNNLKVDYEFILNEIFKQQ